MSNHLAIATVTSVLKEILQEAVSAVPGAGVKVGVPTDEDPDFVGARLFLYLTTPNVNVRNDQIPTRSAEGGLVEIPLVALDCHYLISFYGEKNLESDRMLGSVVSALGAYPFVTPEQIALAIRENDFLEGSDLAEQPERVRWTPIPMNLDELSKLWTVFRQADRRVTLAYKASNIMIEADVSPQKALPVRGVVEP